MSTKTSIKRIALVAVSALGFGLLSVVPSQAVSGTATATVDPVRVSFTDGTRDTVSAASFSFTNIAAEIADGAGTTLTMQVTQAPTSGATVEINLGGSEVTSDSLGAAATPATTGSDVLAAAIAADASATGTIAVTTSPVAGTYKGTFTLGDAADSIVVSWSFTTTGKVASISSSVTSVSLPAIAQSGGAFVTSKSVILTLKDSAGNITQAATGDSLDSSVSGSGTNVAITAGTWTGETSTATELNDGTDTIVVGSRTGTASGAQTVTVTPAGIMPAQGVAAITFSAQTLAIGDTTNADSSMTTPSIGSVAVAVAVTTLEVVPASTEASVSVLTLPAVPCT